MWKEVIHSLTAVHQAPLLLNRMENLQKKAPILSTKL